VDSDSASTTSSNPVVTDSLSTEEGDMVFAAVTCGNLGSYTLNNDFTEGFDQQFGDATTGGMGAAGYKLATGGAEIASATYGASINRQALIVFVINVKPPDPNLPVLNTPLNGQRNVSVITTLQWAAPTAYTPTSYEVFLGTNPVAGENPSYPVDTTEFQPADSLEYGTTYYWAVIAYEGTTPYAFVTRCFSTILAGISTFPTNYQKPRIINTTDLGADPDDRQSMVRFLACSNEFDVEGLIVSTSCWRTS
jgi:hypothetical protein